MKKIIIALLLTISSLTFAFAEDDFRRDIKILKVYGNYNEYEMLKLKDKYFKKLLILVKTAEYNNVDDDKIAFKTLLKEDEAWKKFYEKQKRLLDNSFTYRAGRYYRRYPEYCAELIELRIWGIVKMYDILNHG